MVARQSDHLRIGSRLTIADFIAQNCHMHRPRSVALAACLLLGVAALPAIAEDTQELQYSPWTKFCDEGPGPTANKVCFIGTDARTKSGTLAAAAVLIEGKQKKILRVTVLLGMQLAHGTRLIIDQSRPVTAPYVSCRSNGCISDYDADSDMIAKMQKGQGLTVQAINSNGKPISIVLPFTNFAQVYRGPTTKNSTLNDDQRNLKNIVFNDDPSTLSSDPTIAIYSAWTKVCIKAQEANAKQICFTGADARIKSGASAVAAVLIEPDGEQKKILRVTLPLGVQLAHGTRLIIEQNSPMTAPYVYCVSTGCMSDYEANPDMVAKMENGQVLTVQAISSNGKLISTELPITNFMQAYRGPPTDSRAFEEQQKQIQEELKRLR